MLATNNDALIEKIHESCKTFTPPGDVYHNLALELYRKYLIVGGYPAAVKSYIENENFDSVRSVQADISDSYIADMTKYATPNETIRSIAVFNTLPAQLAKEKSKFQYAVVKSNARAKDYELSLQWLEALKFFLKNTPTVIQSVFRQRISVLKTESSRSRCMRHFVCKTSNKKEHLTKKWRVSFYFY